MRKSRPPQIPENLQQKKLRDLTQEERLRLTFNFLRAGYSLEAIGVARRKLENWQ